MADRVTIQDIADALGLSRNTVSKAINNTGILADSTREKVLQKAVEIGYKQFTYMNISDLNITDSVAQSSPVSSTPVEKDKGEIALFTGAKLGNSHFASTMLDKFQREISYLGYTLTIHRVTREERHSLSLPRSFRPERTAGIMCIEMFNYEYDQMICSLGIPLLFVDTPVLDGRMLKADRLYMDNRNEIFSFVREMVNRGKTKFGFIGEYRHCQSFFERYMAYREALFLNHLPCPDSYSFLENKPGVESPTSTDYQDYLVEQIRNTKDLPEVFIIANDFVAMDVLQAFRKLGISVPEDVLLCGFDDSPESRIVTPPLTSIHIHSEIIGFSAVQLLISRIKEPQLNYRTVYTETNIKYRESTGD